MEQSILYKQRQVLLAVIQIRNIFCCLCADLMRNLIPIQKFKHVLIVKCGQEESSRPLLLASVSMVRGKGKASATLESPCMTEDGHKLNQTEKQKTKLVCGQVCDLVQRYGFADAKQNDKLLSPWHFMHFGKLGQPTHPHSHCSGHRGYLLLLLCHCLLPGCPCAMLQCSNQALCREFSVDS